jgi:hypothetical protein
MTDVYDGVVDTPGAPPAPLPAMVEATAAFAQRMPTQRIIDLIQRVEGGSFGDLVQAQPFRVIAFRALLRDYPDHDPTSLWLHSYDVEVQLDEVPVDPTSSGLTTTSPRSAVTGD